MHIDRLAASLFHLIKFAETGFGVFACLRVSASRPSPIKPISPRHLFSPVFCVRLEYTLTYSFPVSDITKIFGLLRFTGSDLPVSI